MTKSNLADRLNIFVGKWKFKNIDNGTVVITGQTEFKWLQKNAYMIQHSVADPPLPTTPSLWIKNSPFPTTAIIALDDFSQTYTYAYSDGRGVHRLYQMSLEDNVWKVWGQAGPEFYQRFEGIFSIGSKALKVVIEQSKDNKNWETDFDIVYQKTN